jgi:hypothetical protein
MRYHPLAQLVVSTAVAQIALHNEDQVPEDDLLTRKLHRLKVNGGDRATPHEGRDEATAIAPNAAGMQSLLTDKPGDEDDKDLMDCRYASHQSPHPCTRTTPAWRALSSPLSSHPQPPTPSLSPLPPSGLSSDLSSRLRRTCL